jgi:hypothetical protein
LTVDPAGATEEQLTVEGQPSGLGWMPDGSLLVVSMRDHRILRWTPETGATLHADVRRVLRRTPQRHGRRPARARLCGELRLGSHGRRRSGRPPVTPDTAVLDRIDEIVKPGVNLNPADTSYGEQVLEPALRRR